MHVHDMFVDLLQFFFMFNFYIFETRIQSSKFKYHFSETSQAGEDISEEIAIHESSMKHMKAEAEAEQVTHMYTLIILLLIPCFVSFFKHVLLLLLYLYSSFIRLQRLSKQQQQKRSHHNQGRNGLVYFNLLCKCMKFRICLMFGDWFTCTDVSCLKKKKLNQTGNGYMLRNLPSICLPIPI